jgi:hypothetical protein
MGKIQIYRSQVRQQVGPTVRQNLRATPEDFGVGIGEAAAGAVTAGAKLYAKELERQDTAAVVDAHIKATDALVAHEDQLRKNHGLDAIRAGAEAPKALDAALEEIAASLGNDRQRIKFGPLRARLRQQFTRTANRYTAQQGEVFYKSARDGARAKAVQRAGQAAATGDTDLALEVLEDGKEVTRLYSRHMGQSKDDTDAQVLELTTQAHIAIIDALTSEENGDNYDAAKRHLASYEKEIDTKLVKDVRAAIDKSHIRGRSLELVLDIETRVKDDKFGYDLDAALNEIDANTELKKNAALYDMTRDRIRQRHADNTADRRASDSPLVAKMKMAKTLTQARNMKEWPKTSVEGQQSVVAKFEARRNEGRAVQRRLDNLIRLQFQNQPLEWQKTVDVKTHPLLARLSDMGEEEVLSDQIAARKHGVKISAFMAEAVQHAIDAGLSTKKKKDEKSEYDKFLASMRLDYYAWVKKNPDRQPQAADVAEMFARAEVKGKIVKKRLGFDILARDIEGPEWKLRAERKAAEEEAAAEAAAEKVEEPKPAAPPEPMTLGGRVTYSFAREYVDAWHKNPKRTGDPTDIEIIEAYDEFVAATR